MKKSLSVFVSAIFLFSGLFIFNSCDKEDKRVEEELIKLQQYLEDNGYADLEPTSSGLYYVVLEDGDGPTPEISDYVNIEFTGFLVDGTVFETSSKSIAEFRNIFRDDKLYGPAKFHLEQLGIQGLREGIMMIKEGGKSRLIIPSKLAFGSSDLGIIGPYSTVIYDVELLDVISDPEEHEQNLLDQYLEDNDISIAPTESGLYYVETLDGSGDLPGSGSTVTVHYQGYLLDGRLFDESSTGTPLVVNMGATNIIPGFIEGLSKMKKGAEATLIIPWDIAYGSGGSTDGIIPPYSTLVFDVKVVDIQ